MGAINASVRSCILSCARSVLARRGVGYPSSLALLWPAKLTAAGVLKSAKGVDPTYTDTPTLSAGGVVPGDGPAFEDVVTWADGGTLVVEFTATTASADLVGDVQVFGPLYAYSGGLKAKDGTNEASVATEWDVGDVVTGWSRLTRRLGCAWATAQPSATTLLLTTPSPPSASPPPPPGDLKQVQTWSKVASAKEIERY